MHVVTQIQAQGARDMRQESDHEILADRLAARLKNRAPIKKSDQFPEKFPERKMQRIDAPEQGPQKARHRHLYVIHGFSEAIEEIIERRFPAPDFI